MSVNWDLYEKYIKDGDTGENSAITNESVADMISDLKNTPNYQPNATHNGVTRPLCMTIKDGRIGKAIMLDALAIYAGDYIHCYDRDWLVVEVKVDEFGMTHATCWLCNYTLKFQNNTSTINSRLVVVDDGSYSSRDKKQIATVIGSRSIFLPRDDKTKYIFPGKRLAVGTIFNSDGIEICDAYLVRYEDHLGTNLSDGDHLERLDLENTDFSQERDSVEYCVCDYIAGIIEEEEPQTACCESNTEEGNEGDSAENGDTSVVPIVTYHIVGNKRIRLGTTRTYTLYDNSEEPQFCTWTVNGSNGMTYSVDNQGVLVLSMGTSPLLIGTTIELSAKVNLSVVATTNVEVISIA